MLWKQEFVAFTESLENHRVYSNVGKTNEKSRKRNNYSRRKRRKSIVAVRRPATVEHTGFTSRGRPAYYHWWWSPRDLEFPSAGLRSQSTTTVGAVFRAAVRRLAISLAASKWVFWSRPLNGFGVTVFNSSLVTATRSHAFGATGATDAAVGGGGGGGGRSDAPAICLPTWWFGQNCTRSVVERQHVQRDRRHMPRWCQSWSASDSCMVSVETNEMY